MLFAWVGGFLLRFNLDVPDSFMPALWWGLALLLPLHALACRVAGLYRGIWLFASLPDLKRVLRAVALSTAAVIGFFVLFRDGQQLVPRSLLLLYPMLLVLYMGGGRAAYRMWKEHRLYGGLVAQGKPVVIVGAGRGGAMLVRELERSADWRVVGLVDDDRSKWGRELSGHPVLGGLDSLPEVLDSEKASHVILAMPSAAADASRRAADLAVGAGAHVFTVPGLEDVMSGRVAISALRPVEIEDLLGRASVMPDTMLLGRCIAGKVVLVTGAGGSIGSELCRQIVRLGPVRLVMFEISEFALYSIEQELLGLCAQARVAVELVPVLGTVMHQSRAEAVMRSFGVNTVYHSAAYKHVPLVEHNPVEGIRNNAVGTRRMAEAALAAGVDTFVLISTDKAVRPTNVMGASKRLAELILQALANQGGKTRFCMVRFGNVLGSSGSVVPLFRQQIAAGGPITLTHPEITRFFMTIPEAAQLVIQAGAMGQGGEVFVLDMGQPVKIVDLARRMIHLSGLEVRDDEHPDGDIAIDIVGLRPGEKLYEELLIGENIEGTSHPLIMRAYENEVPWEIMSGRLAQLDAACMAFDFPKVLALLGLLVQEYTPATHGEDALLWRALAEPGRGDVLVH